MDVQKGSFSWSNFLCSVMRTIYFEASFGMDISPMLLSTPVGDCCQVVIVYAFSTVNLSLSRHLHIINTSFTRLVSHPSFPSPVTPRHPSTLSPSPCLNHSPPPSCLDATFSTLASLTPSHFLLPSSSRAVSQLPPEGTSTQGPPTCVP